MNLPFNTDVIATIFNEDATFLDLLALVLALAVFWFVIFAIAAAIIKPLVMGKPWLIAAGERDYDRGGKELWENVGAPKTKAEFVVSFMDMWAWNQTLAIQHLIGGAVCLPAIIPGHLGLDPSVAASLACLGILSEMGWEIEDQLTWIYKRFFTKGGKEKVPNALLIVLGIHHSMTTILGLPMVLNYRDLPTLHWLCFDLQAAAAISLMVTEYTKLLDITKPNQLRQFQSLTFFGLVVMVVTRGFHWVFLCGSLLVMWYQEGRWGFLVVGTIISALFSMFNYAFCIEPYYKWFTKFVKVSAEYKKLPADAPARDTASSISRLPQLTLSSVATSRKNLWQACSRTERSIAELLCRHLPSVATRAVRDHRCFCFEAQWEMSPIFCRSSIPSRRISRIHVACYTESII